MAHYRDMTIDDYEAVVALWVRISGLKLREADSREGIETYLRRNPGMSVVAEKDGDIVGTIMAGHDGKRGYIQHLAVDAGCRKQGIASELLARCLSSLKKEGIIKSHVFVLADNDPAKTFWLNRGWKARGDISTFSYINGGGSNT